MTITKVHPDLCCSEDDNEDTLSTNEIFFENKKWIDGDITMQCHSIAIPYPHITHIPFPSRSYLSGLIFASSVAMRDVTALCHESWNDPGESRGNITDHCHQWSIKTSCWTSMKRQQSRETKFISFENELNTPDSSHNQGLDVDVKNLLNAGSLFCDLWKPLEGRSHAKAFNFHWECVQNFCRNWWNWCWLILMKHLSTNKSWPGDLCHTHFQAAPGSF